MDTPKWTIYCHIHVESGRRYVGLTKKTMLQRWNQHVYMAAKVTGRGWSYFANAIRKYGKDAFSHEVLETCPTIEEGNAAEERWIEELGTRDPEKGFNLMKGGAHTPHPITNPWDRPEYRAQCSKNIVYCHTPQARAKGMVTLTKEKRSAATKKAMTRPEVRQRHRELHEAPGYKERISVTTKAALARPEVRAKVVAANRAALLDSGLQERKRAAVKAAEQRPEVVAKLSAASKARWARPEYRARALSRECSEETRARISAASTGKRHTPESVERQRELYLQRSSTCKFCDSPIEGKRTCIKGRVACQWCFFLHKSGRACFLRPDGSFV